MGVANAWGLIHPHENPGCMCIMSNGRLQAVGRNCPAVGAEKRIDNQRRNKFLAASKNFAHAKGAASKRRYGNQMSLSIYMMFKRCADCLMAVLLGFFIDTVFFQQLSERAAFLAGESGGSRHVAVGFLDQFRQVIALEFGNGLCFRLLEIQ